MFVHSLSEILEIRGIIGELERVLREKVPGKSVVSG